MKTVEMHLFVEYLPQQQQEKACFDYINLISTKRITTRKQLNSTKKNFYLQEKIIDM